MTLYLQISILVFLLLVIFGNNAQQLDMKAQPKKLDLADLTRGLSDAEIEMALSDLTLSDLNVLSKLIDTSNAADYYYEDDSITNNNERARPFEDVKTDECASNGNMDDLDDDSDEQIIREPRNLLQFKIPRDTLASSRTENQRSKRENAQQPKEVSVDEDYLKQLEYSFPREQPQNDETDYYEEKNEHVRVKRN